MAYTKITRELDDRPLETILLEFDLPADLAAGSHTETINGYNGSALVKTVTRNFITEATVIFEAETTTYMNAISIPDNSSPSIYTGKTNHQIWVAVDNLVKKLKTDALLAVINRAYLRLGNTANQQSINLKDVAANGTYYGGWVFNNLGAIANGTTSYFDSGVDLGIIYGGVSDAGTTQVLNSIEIGSELYGCSIGSTHNSSGRHGFFPAWDNNLSKVSVFIKGILKVNISEGAGAGVHTLVAVGTAGNHYKNGTLRTTAAFSGINPSANIFEGAYNDRGATVQYFKGNIGASAYHGGLNATHALNLYNALNDFEIEIGRKQYA